uniref:Uncharacterized protein n=1 Tax=Ascaris lumbricoides TaxID=6252 RepID=A0A0M3HVH8_ASCLU
MDGSEYASRSASAAEREGANIESLDGSISSVSKKVREPPVKKRIVRQPSPVVSDVSFTFSSKCSRLEKTQHRVKAKSGSYDNLGECRFALIELFLRCP